MADVRTAVITEDPRQVEGSDGVTRWRVRALESLTSYALDCQISLRAGEWWPFRQGDVVTVVLPYGSTQGPEIVGAKGLAGVEPTSPDNIEIRARPDGDGEPTSIRLLAPDGRVDLGEGEPGDQERVAMHPKIAAELKALKGAIDELATWVGVAQTPSGTSGGPLIPGNPAIPTPAAAVAQGLGGESITGGEPATNVYAQADTDG